MTLSILNLVHVLQGLITWSRVLTDPHWNSQSLPSYSANRNPDMMDEYSLCRGQVASHPGLERLFITQQICSCLWAIPSFPSTIFYSFYNLSPEHGTWKERNLCLSVHRECFLQSTCIGDWITGLVNHKVQQNFVN